MVIDEEARRRQLLEYLGTEVCEWYFESDGCVVAKGICRVTPHCTQWFTRKNALVEKEFETIRAWFKETEALG